MIQKIKSWLNKERLNGHQPNEDPHRPPPKSGGADPQTAPTRINPEDIQDPTKKDQKISFNTEEIDLEGKPSQLLVIQTENMSDLEIEELRDELKFACDQTNLEPEDRKQMFLISGGDVQFQTLDLSGENDE